MSNLTTPLALPNGTRLNLIVTNVDSVKEEMRILVELRGPVGAALPDAIVSRRTIGIRNTTSDKIRKAVAFSAGQLLEEVLEIVQNAIVSPTAFDDAATAIFTGVKAGRKAALETAGITAGWIDASLA